MPCDLKTTGGPPIRGILTPDDAGGRYIFDAEAADRVCRFFESHLKLYADRWAGQPFKLSSWQRKALRDIYGWRSVATGRRRYRDVWVEGPKGVGKSDWLAGIGLYELAASEEAAVEIYSAASNHQQARITYESAQKIIARSDSLNSRLDVNERLIRNGRDGKWATLSGSERGKHGIRPNVVLFDEIHELGNDKLFRAIRSNLHKRSDPLFVMATNAGDDKASLCYELHQRAVSLLEGASEDESFYPIVFMIDEDDDWEDESNWVKAFPNLGETITIDSLRIEHKAAKGSPQREAKFRRLYLGQWLAGTDRWLNMAHWDSCVGGVPKSARELPLWIGVDLAPVDDLCAIAYLWADHDAGHYYARVQHFATRETAYRLEDRLGLPVKSWVDEGYLKLIEEATVGEASHRRFARGIIKAASKYDFREVCYDRNRASQTISRLNKAGVVNVPVNASAWAIGPAVDELERLLAARQITIRDNPLLRWQASVVEVQADSNSNRRVTKPGARGRYAGSPNIKIDGIVAIINALHGAMQYARAGEERDGDWDGSILVV